MYLWIFPVWFLVMCIYGLVLETRVFGELGALLALASALVFEETVRLLPNGRTAVDSNIVDL